jgi:prepilin-type N-terminal cleavage/methylation domain-containing protein
LIRKPLEGESGYSLVEVMVSIVIFAIAIVPMVSMFDVGLRSATTGGNYDKARTLANLKLEQAKTLPFDTVRDNFPETAPTTTTYNGSGNYQSTWKTESGAAASDFANFEYRIEKQYMVQPSQAPTSSSENFATSSTATSLIRVTVTVRWGNNNTYTAFGLVTA